VTIFALIWLSYTLIAVNTRAVSSGKYISTMVTDAAIAVVGFFLIKSIVIGGLGQLTWYVAGAMAGGASGIFISKRLEGK
jgi:outer membrane lipoprotein SlyB